MLCFAVLCSAVLCFALLLPVVILHGTWNREWNWDGIGMGWVKKHSLADGSLRWQARQGRAGRWYLALLDS